MNCLTCGKEFTPKVLPQGGGRKQVYCSRRCGARRWVRFAKYGWDHVRVEKQLERQNHSCAGCLEPITEGTCHVDHDHQTGTVRGLLCSGCNRALGSIKDNPTTLRRLMAYLDRDFSRPLVYLIGALKNHQRIPMIGRALRLEGLDVMDDWITPGPEADSFWQSYSINRGQSYIEALKGRAATNIFLFDRSYLDLADFVVLVMPAGKSAMLELGYAKGRGKKTLIFLDGNEPERYDIMPNFADAVVMTEDEVTSTLRSWKKGITQ